MLHVVFGPSVKHALRTVVVSTAYVEALFAHFGQWLSKSTKPCSLALLQAKHVASAWRRDHRLRKSAAQRPRKKWGKPKRPEWIFKKGEKGRVTARHVFLGDFIAAKPPGCSSRDAFREAQGAWRAASPKAKARAKAIAGERASRARALKQARLHRLHLDKECESSGTDDEDGGEYPLSTVEVRESMSARGGVRRRSVAWASGAARCAEDSAMPQDIETSKADNSALHSLSAEQRSAAERVLDDLAALFGAGSDAADRAKPLLCADESGSWCALLRCCFALRSRPFSGDFVVYHIDDAESPWHAGIVQAPVNGILRRAPLPSPLRGRTPSCMTLFTESELAAALVTLPASGRWCFRRATVEYGETLAQAPCAGASNAVADNSKQWIGAKTNGTVPEEMARHPNTVIV